VTRRFALLVNPSAAAGRALRRLPVMRAELDRLGAEHRVVETRSIEHAAEEARTAAAGGETVGALGGDGFVRPVAAALRNSDVALAVLPGGRGNDFARTLGIPDEPVEAARFAVEGPERLVDVAEANGTPYIGIASMGFDSVANKLANETRMVRGNLVYLYAGISALASWEPAAFEVEVDGASTSVRGYTVAVANSKAYGGGMFIAPQAELDDGLLDVVVIGEIPKLRFLRGMPTVFKGEHLGRPGVSVLRGERVRVTSDREFDVYADGDPIARTPVDLTVERGCLRVIAPEAGPPR
jgi:YegS/Rv2252/BmrU family lipid kinase